MKPIFAKAILFLLFPLVIAGCDWYNWNPPPGSGNAVLSFHVTTNTGGPSSGPLGGAPIHVIAADGSIQAHGVSDKDGNLVLKLDAGTYVVDPQEVPGHEDFYWPPEPQTVTLIAAETLELRLHYDNPIL